MNEFVDKRASQSLRKWALRTSLMTSEVLLDHRDPEKYRSLYFSTLYGKKSTTKLYIEITIFAACMRNAYSREAVYNFYQSFSYPHLPILLHTYFNNFGNSQTQRFDALYSCSQFREFLKFRTRFGKKFVRILGFRKPPCLAIPAI